MAIASVLNTAGISRSIARRRLDSRAAEAMGIATKESAMAIGPRTKTREVTMAISASAAVETQSNETAWRRSSETAWAASSVLTPPATPCHEGRLPSHRTSPVSPKASSTLVARLVITKARAPPRSVGPTLPSRAKPERKAVRPQAAQVTSPSIAPPPFRLSSGASSRHRGSRAPSTGTKSGRACQSSRIRRGRRHRNPPV